MKIVHDVACDLFMSLPLTEIKTIRATHTAGYYMFSSSRICRINLSVASVLRCRALGLGDGPRERGGAG